MGAVVFLFCRLKVFWLPPSKVPLCCSVAMVRFRYLRETFGFNELRSTFWAFLEQCMKAAVLIYFGRSLIMGWVLNETSSVCALLEASYN